MYACTKLQLTLTETWSNKDSCYMVLDYQNSPSQRMQKSRDGKSYNKIVTVPFWVTC